MGEQHHARRRSLIAGANAWFRAAEGDHPVAARILEDAWALRLAERDPRIWAVRGLRRVVPPLKAAVRHLQIAHCVRHRVVDELVLAAIRDGYRQVVVVGAGYDMRPSRFAPVLGGVRWIEIDAPETQARKWRRLAGVAGVRAVDRVATDLESEPFHASLARAGLDAEEPTCFVIEGLVHYLSPLALDNLLKGLGAHRGKSRLVLTFIDNEMRDRGGPILKSLFRAMRERPRSFLSAEAMASRLEDQGFKQFTAWRFTEQVDAFIPLEVRARRNLAAQWWQTVGFAQSTGERA